MLRLHRFVDPDLGVLMNQKQSSNPPFITESFVNAIEKSLNTFLDKSQLFFHRPPQSTYVQAPSLQPFRKYLNTFLHFFLFRGRVGLS